MAELASVGLGHQGPGQAVCLSAQLTPDKFRARGYIAPLVTAAHLELAAVVLVEVCEVVALEQLVGELSEGHALASLSAESLLDRILGHHIIDGDELAYLAGEVEESPVLHPVVVVDQNGGVGSLALKVNEPGELGLDALLVVTEGILVEKIALLRLHRGVADHAGSSSDKGDRAVAGVLEVLEHHDADQMADVQ